METEAQLIAGRATLRWLVKQHPSWTQAELAAYLGKSRDWVKKWLKRLRQADPTDVTVLHSRSRARKTPPPSIASQPQVVERILEIRDIPPENLHRVPGSEALLYYLQRDQTLQATGVRLPRSQTTIWKILRSHGRIAPARRRKPRPQEPREPGEEVQFDLKDASSVPADPTGKQQHIVEIANFVDAGTSIWLKHVVHEEFTAETLLETVAAFLREYGLPGMLTLDHDPRFVGSASGRDFPSALVGFLLCVGVQPNICPPHRPDKNAYVERFHRTLGQECLQRQLPRTFQQVRDVTQAFEPHYNQERPKQARSCGNVPPRVACPVFPPLPKVPDRVDPDHWLGRIHQQVFARTGQANGSLTINHESYYISRTLAGKAVICLVNAPEKCFEIWQAHSYLKQVPIKGL